MPRQTELSAREARYLAIAAQGLGTPRSPSSVRPRATRLLEQLMGRLGTIQLDAVNVVERTQYLVAFSRIGSFRRDDLRTLTLPGGTWFEYWGHAASLLPLELYPLLRSRMERRASDLEGGPTVRERRQRWRAAHAEYLRDVLSEVEARGPLAASELAEPRRRSGEWWDRRSDGRLALEVLFGDGTLAAWRSASFERIYDLTERVIPAAIRKRPAPGLDDAERELIAVAAHCTGVATISDLADYFWIAPTRARLRVGELVEEGRLRPVRVEGWRPAAYVLPDARPRPPRRATATLLSPFDSLIWTRQRTERLFGFHYRIEIYVPPARRRHGYYVMPLLVGDRLAARLDLKADRAAGVLQVRAAHLEPGNDPDAVAQAALDELTELQTWLGLAACAVAPNGDLASWLARRLR